MSANPDNLVGRKLDGGRFEVKSLLGTGGMANVYLAADHHLKTDVVIKVPQRKLLEDEHFLNRFRRELQVLALMPHKHIVTIIDIGAHAGVPFGVMRYLDGGNLAERLEPTDGGSGLRFSDGLSWLSSVAEALDFIHQQGVVHRDVKPENILFDKSGSVYLSDFGIAKAIGDKAPAAFNATITRVGELIGTPAYMAPEAYLGQPLTGSADQFAVAVILYEIFAGRRPFEKNSAAELMIDKVSRPKMPSESPPTVVEALERALSVVPSQRFATCVDFAAAVLQDLPAIANVELPKRKTMCGIDDGLLQGNDVLKHHGIETTSPTEQRDNRRGDGSARSAPRSIASERSKEDSPQTEQVPTATVRDTVRLGAADRRPTTGSSTAVSDPLGKSSGGNRPGRFWAVGIGLVAVGLGIFFWNRSVDHDDVTPRSGDSDDSKTSTVTRDSLDDPRFMTNSIGMKLRRIPAGEFQMGSHESAEAVVKAFKVDDESSESLFLDEHPRHRVRITKPFYLGIHEVTVGQFEQFVGAQNYRTEAEREGNGAMGYNREIGQFEGPDSQYHWKNPGFEQHDNQPVVNVTWNDANAFCEWLSRKEGKKYRLPTEAEWEYACRAGTTGHFVSGDDPLDLADVANVADITANRLLGETYDEGWSDGEWFITEDFCVFTSAVGRYSPNAFDLYDMHGNVWEWCADWYSDQAHAASRSEDPTGPRTGTLRVLRGGS